MDLIKSSGMMQYRQIEFTSLDGYDDYLVRLSQSEADMIVISVPGAKGMEAAIAARDTNPNAALIWFTDDDAFGAQSYRIDCTYFTAKPVDDKVMAEAITRYYQSERCVCG